MLPGLCSAGGAALCYGIGSVLQADAARRTAASAGLDPRLLARLLRSGRYLVGVGADGAGFLLSLLAVRTLPLFVVQSVVASFLAVTAVLAAVLLRMPLGTRDRVGVGWSSRASCSSAPPPPRTTPWACHRPAPGPCSPAPSCSCPPR